mmetsp:Transcript_29414/g.83767  ORF Transcript_29414/g.83767 Transcript_29414/m.83767 type:complete len:333 (-) Transcript_29414:116-1114(-)
MAPPAGGKGDRKGAPKGGRKGGGKGRGDDGREVKSRLSSDAPDFTPAADFDTCGYDYDDEMLGYWGWQPQPLPLWREFADPEGVPYYYNSKTGLCQWERPTELDPPKPAPPPPAEPEAPPAPRVQTAKEDRSRARPGPREGEEAARRTKEGEAAGARGSRGGEANRTRRRGKEDAKKDGGDFGPPGCNLFVFHLPDDWTDDDLHEYFAPHGNVVSAKVMKELGTGRSRGFGFVSYEDRVSAATAIKKMQGYKILGKRLKVEFKKGEANDAADLGDDPALDEEGAGKKTYPDDERLIGYLRAISAKNVVQSLKESELAEADEARDVGDDEGAS